MCSHLQIRKIKGNPTFGFPLVMSFIKLFYLRFSKNSCLPANLLWNFRYGFNPCMLYNLQWISYTSCLLFTILCMLVIVHNFPLHSFLHEVSHCVDSLQYTMPHVFSFHGWQYIPLYTPTAIWHGG